MSDQSASSNDVDAKLLSLRTEIVQICSAITQIEAQLTNDRCYTTIDLIEALQLITRIYLERLNDGFDDWKNDEDNEYSSLFESIKQQTRITIENTFKNNKGKTIQFVNTFNNLVGERVAELSMLLGPSATLSLIDPIINQIVEEIGDIEEIDNAKVGPAHDVLSQYRSEPSKKKTSVKKDNRLDYIRGLFEKLREAA